MTNHHRKAHHCAASLAMLTLSVAACSDDDRLSTAEFLKQGNAICQAGQAKIDAAASRAFPNQDERPDPVVFQTLANETLIPSVKEQLDGIDALKAPDDLQDALDRMISDGRAALDKMEAEINADTDAFIDSEVDHFGEVNEQAAAIGLTVCANP